LFRVKGSVFYGIRACFHFFTHISLAASIVAFYLSFVASTVDEVPVLAEVSVLVEAGAPESVAAGAVGVAGWEVILSKFFFSCSGSA
jgi:hypothetical protein